MKTMFVEPMQFDENEVFIEARQTVQYFFEIHLSILELWHLRRYVRESIRGLTGTFQLEDLYNPAIEAVARFFVMEYGIDPHDKDLLNLLYGYQPDALLLRYIKIIQEKMHLL